jgi:hypothetical protein
MGPAGRRLAAGMAVLGTVAVASTPTATPAAPPCAPGTFPVPEIRSTDRYDGARLTATHPIGLEARFASDDPGGVTWSGAGVRGDTLLAPLPGPVVVRASWEQFPPSGNECTASTAATLNVQPAVTPKLVARRPSFAGIAFDLRFVRAAPNLGPLELRLRAVRGPRLPGPRVRFVVRSLNVLNEQSRTFATQIHVTLHADPSQMFDSRNRLLRNPYITFVVGGGHIGKRFQRRGYGFELQVSQGGRRIGRARGTADRCDPRFDCRQRSLRVTS